MHVLRHTYASLLLRSGVDVVRLSKWLGHKHVSITLRTYAHMIPESAESTRRDVEHALSGTLSPSHVDEKLTLRPTGEPS
jgi:site-specific recombinase XerD